MEPASGEGDGSLNPYHKHHLLVSCQYVDQLLSDIENILTAASSKAAFPKYAVDIGPAQKKVVEDYMARIRAQMLRVIEGQGIERAAPRFGALHSIQTTLLFVENSLEELKPKYMRGYGRVPEAAVPELNGLVTELQGLVEKLRAYLAQGLGKDLQGRLARLEQTTGEIELLRTLERIITGHGLVEFRQALSIIVDRMEENSFEIALFGRVSSGKSSLLNHLLQSPVLPVGVTPITAVPTRIQHGSAPRLTVWFAGRAAEQFSIEKLAEFADERRNPANSRNVTRILLELPSSRLPAGVVFVDTPGLGSLATAGAAETMAYLPRCDLACLLIDAGSTLTQEDLVTIRSLYEAAIPTFVLLSKADLLQAEDRAPVLQYIADHLTSDLGLRLAVHPVSVVGEHTVMLERFLEQELLPLYAQQQTLARQSLRRKIGSLREGVEAALRVRLERATTRAPGDDQRARHVETALRRATGKIEEARLLCDKQADEVSELARSALERAASAIVEAGMSKDAPDSDFAARVTEALTHAAAEPAAAIYQALEKLSRSLARALNQAAHALGLNDAPLEKELAAGLKEMPRLDLGMLRLDLRPAFRFAVGKRMAHNRVARRLRAQIGAQVQQAFHSYGRLLEAWANRTLAELRSRFDSHADAYRAQLERLIGKGGVSERDREAIQQDLGALAQSAPAGQVPVLTPQDARP